MFSVNRTDNTITRLDKRSFRDLEFRGREHVQEWLCKHPEALGGLLIIQKEFTGFDNTKERLDLLALDRSGQLVLIENKLDDSGRDVTWQALKYAAYCSTLKTSQIIEIYSRHLEQSVDAAREAIADFVSAGDSEELTLNTANSQRIMLVAANFRPEVTATALWLIGRGVSITCFEVTPFCKGDDLFLTLNQIIPPPQASDYMVKLAEKSAVEETLNKAKSARNEWRQKYWDALFEKFHQSGSSTLSGATRPGDSYLFINSDRRGIYYSINVLASEVRVQINIASADGTKNSEAFQALRTSAEKENSEYARKLEWYNPPNAKACRIKESFEIDTTNPDNWPEAIEWQRQRLEAMIAAFSPHIKGIAAL